MSVGRFIHNSFSNIDITRYPLHFYKTCACIMFRVHCYMHMYWNHCIPRNYVSWDTMVSLPTPLPPLVSALYLENRCTNHSQISHTSLVTYKLVTYRFWELLKKIKNENKYFWNKKKWFFFVGDNAHFSSLLSRFDRITWIA